MLITSKYEFDLGNGFAGWEENYQKNLRPSETREEMEDKK